MDDSSYVLHLLKFPNFPNRLVIHQLFGRPWKTKPNINCGILAQCTQYTWIETKQKASVHTFEFNWSANCPVWNVLNTNRSSTRNIFIYRTESCCWSIAIITVGFCGILVPLFLQWWCVLFSNASRILLRWQWCGWPSNVCENRWKKSLIIMSELKFWCSQIQLTSKFWNVQNYHQIHGDVRSIVCQPIQIYCNVYCIQFHYPIPVDEYTKYPYWDGSLAYSQAIPMNYVKEYFLFYLWHPNYHAVKNCCGFSRVHSMNYQLDLCVCGCVRQSIGEGGERKYQIK